MEALLVSNLDVKHDKNVDELSIFFVCANWIQIILRET